MSADSESFSYARRAGGGKIMNLPASEKQSRAGMSPGQAEAPRRGSGMGEVLRQHLALCREALELSLRENQALTAPAGYVSSDFHQRRKDLLPRLEESLMSLSTWRKRWQEFDPVDRAGDSEVKSLAHAVQDALTRILLLDRENQQALLRRGQVPARHLPTAAVQRPHCVADAYRRHSRA